MQIAALYIDERYRRLRLHLDCPQSLRPTSAMIFTALDDTRVSVILLTASSLAWAKRENRKLASDTEGSESDAWVRAVIATPAQMEGLSRSSALRG